MSTLPWRIVGGPAIDVTQVASAAAQSSGSVWLDGGDRSGSWLGLEPRRELVGTGFEVFSEIEETWRTQPQALFMGWVSYECGVGQVLGREVHRPEVPAFCLRQFDSALRIEAHGEARVVGSHRGIIGQLQRARPLVPAWHFGDLAPLWPYHHYRSCIEEVLAQIGAGNTYQVNLSQRFAAPWKDHAGGGSREARARAAATAYLALRQRAPASLGALIDVGDGRWILSNSPETLLTIDATQSPVRLTSSPIKGTRPRGTSPEHDAALQAQLQASGKDRAEHVMIVDLVRNDLGRVAAIGSVVAPTEPSCLTLPTVHHLVTQVCAQADPAFRMESIWRAIFPGGSVTGTPKRRTIEIIAELEGEARGIYCGAILALWHGRLCASIPIRTALAGERGLSMRSGGGVVADSDAASEYAETLAKARAFAG